MGKEHLAKLIAQALKQRPVYVHADKQGVYLYKDTENKFSPVRKVVQADVDAFVSDLAEAKKANPKLDVSAVTVPEVGGLMPSEDWEPYIEFIPKDRAQYGR